MAENKIQPHTVTKPIQLLAAWLVGLVMTNTLFLTSAAYLEIGSWERGALVVASIVNVPVFLLALFILQTKFRAELQEDTFYSEYLSKKTATLVRIDKNSIQDSKLEELEKHVNRLIEVRFSQPLTDDATNVETSIDWTDWPVALNDLHPSFKEIRESLRTANIPLSEIFGNSRLSGEAPKKWIVALSHNLPTVHKVHLLRVVLPHGFDGFQFWEPHREAEENEDVYIGSYGIETYAQVTPELFELLENRVESVDLMHYCINHKTVFNES